jgi:poly(hydroxyalkanoate) depolymerase family esterase
MRLSSVARLFRRLVKPRAKTRRAVAAFLKPAAPSPAAAFGSNPGALRMHSYAPARLCPGRPLIVVLHGCGQSATRFAADTGWIALADELRLALLLPEQTRENNRAGCFNWFSPGDTRRGSGEAMSIRQMIRAAVKQFGSNPSRVFVVGFSAGGGMAAALLAAYPAVFAAGGVVAGMPVGCARSALSAILRMRRGDTGRSGQALANDALAASGSAARKSWPRLSIWQGESDRTVDPGNAEVLAKQWSELQGLGAEPLTDRTEAGARHRAWGRPNRPPSVELWTIPALGHAFTVGAGLSATRRMAEFWGLTGGTSL